MVKSLLKAGADVNQKNKAIISVCMCGSDPSEHCVQFVYIILLNFVFEFKTRGRQHRSPINLIIIPYPFLFTLL